MKIGIITDNGIISKWSPDKFGYYYSIQMGTYGIKYNYDATMTGHNGEIDICNCFQTSLECKSVMSKILDMIKKNTWTPPDNGKQYYYVDLGAHGICSSRAFYCQYNNDCNCFDTKQLAEDMVMKIKNLLIYSE